MNDNKTKLRANAKAVPIPLASGHELNSDQWMIAGVPLGDGKFWMYQDKNAKVLLEGDQLSMDINPFSSSHDQIQFFDNPKQLYLTKSSFEPGTDGIIGFSCNMRASINGGNIDDHRDGFGSFNVLDFATGMVLDIITNGHKVWVIYERLFMPGVTTLEQAFTEVIPVDYAVKQNDFLKCLVVYERNNNAAQFFLDDKLIFTAENIPVKIQSLQTGFGFITLLPITDGHSVSCKGQGGTGTWGGFTYIRN